MDNIEELDFTIKNVIYELIRECKNKSVEIMEDFIIYYVELLTLNPLWGIIPRKLPSRNDVHNFIIHTTQKLENTKCPCMITLKMQFYFQQNFNKLARLIQKNRNEIKCCLEPLLKEIADVPAEKGFADLEAVFKKIVFLITLYSGLGNPALNPVYKEAEAALRSILSDEDLISFLNESSTVRRAQIEEFTELVTGIRLFNRDCEKGGVGIEDLPKLLNEAIEVVVNDIQKTLTNVMEQVYTLTTALDRCYHIEEYGDTFVLSLNVPENVAKEDVENIKNVLIVFRQYESLIRKILAEVYSMELTSKQTLESLQGALKEIHKVLRFRIAVCTSLIFPLFSKLANIWRQFQDQIIVLSQINQLLDKLQSKAKYASVDPKILKTLVGRDGTVTDADRLEKTTGLFIPLNDNICVLNPAEIQDFDELTLEYMGFCAWTLIESNGFLIPGNPNMGVMYFESKYYVFSSVEAAQSFSVKPKRYTLLGLELARQKPEFINLLQLEKQLKEVYKIEVLVIRLLPETAEEIPMYDNETQTEIHPIPTNIDPNYKWNIWDWKRDALFLAQLLRCKTTSSQTINSQAIESSCTQTYENKNAEQQTKKDNYSNVPKLSNYIYGLRGRLDNNQHIITLTRPIDESFLRPKCATKFDHQLKKKK
ncbi:hypothetical protein FQR65_LT10183 [Abscondita terminalis]|nr:hypothetical protein FQR65_LT10183 [Abscondita terminalis]